MSKTASKMRQDTKIVVSTEVEETRESSRESEISNPNDEIAVTYIFSRLQRQYEIWTELAEANACVFVAERVPTPAEIDDQWIRTYDWILSRSLLDESFRGDLETLIGYYSDSDEGTDGVDGQINALMETISTGIPSHASVPGSPPDVYATPQNAYEREVERARARRTARNQYLRCRRRLRRHIFDNILHYCRAIWSAEDPQQRLLRFSKISVASQWSFIGRPSAEGVYVGVWAPSVGGLAKLSDLINPAGPIGFAGNYAVYYLKQNGRYPEIDDAVGYLRLPYTDHTAVGRVISSADPTVSVVVTVSPNRLGAGEYILEVASDGSGGLVCNISMLDTLSVDVDSSGVASTDVYYDTLSSIPIDGVGATVRFHGLRVVLSVAEGSLLSAGDRFRVEVFVHPRLEDPEVRSIRFSQSSMSSDQEAEFYSPEVLSEFDEYFPAVRRAIGRLEMPPSSWEELDESVRNLVRERLPDYLVRKAHTRRFLLETNNVLLSRAVDPATSIEPFKSLHRYLDVLSAAADMEKKLIENRRYQARVDSDLLGDPDVEKVTVVAAASNAAGLAALDGLTDDPGSHDDVPGDGS
ncbi:hypothetical protein GCM10011348_15790 [Marinobacterium nitratireducens]|uniref:Uncharacterized protein n=2 Tax=Marinobacterium nitratireducens TaxID=518897 RepID=A0A918DRY6_9GAMM|nr:hypothetical protein GCM10011348_15790 [Marinobacterium nitratireducens]